MKRSVPIIAILILSTLVLAGCRMIGLASTPQSTPIPTVEGNQVVISQGNLVPRDYAYLSFPLAGHLSQILVKQGDQVSAGQVLASLGDREQYHANVTEAQLEVENAQKSVNDLNKKSSLVASNAWLALLDAKEGLIQAEEAWSKVDTGAYQQMIDDANIKVSDMQTALNDAQTKFNEFASLEANNPARKIAQTDLDKAQQDYDSAVHAYDQLLINHDRAQASLQLAQAMQTQAQSDYDTTRQGTDPEQLKLAQMNLDTAQAHLASAQAALDNLDLKAPFTGTVVEVNASNRDLVNAGTWVVLIADYSEWYVETNDMTEQKVVNISIGQVASITPDALPDVTVKGKVTEIDDVSHMQAGDVLYTARLLLDQTSQRFRWGMTVEISSEP
jgi:HlyD family secretion protein